MGPCHATKRLSKSKPIEAKMFTEKAIQNLAHPDMSQSLQNSQIPKGIDIDEKQLYDKLDYFLSSDVGFKLRSGVQIRNLLNSIKPTGILNDFILMELSKLIYQRIKEQDLVIKDYHRYISSIKQIIEISRAILDSTFLKLETDKILQFTNKSCAFIVFSNLLILFHAIIFHKSVMLVKPEDRWWTKNKSEENLGALLSLIIEISGKIKYEYEPKFSKKNKNPMYTSRVISVASHDVHEDPMLKSWKSNESRGEKNKKESDFFYGMNPHFNDLINEVENGSEPKLKYAKSSEDIVAKYRTKEEIKEDPDDDEINDEHQISRHKAADCEKYLFNLSPSVKKSLKDKN